MTGPAPCLGFGHALRYQSPRVIRLLNFPTEAIRICDYSRNLVATQGQPTSHLTFVKA